MSDDMKMKIVDTRMCLAKAVWKLINDESEANEEYAEFLACHKDKLTDKQIAMIKEHMADEYNHILELGILTEEITKVKPTID